MTSSTRSPSATCGINLFLRLGFTTKAHAGIWDATEESCPGPIKGLGQCHHRSSTGGQYSPARAGKHGNTTRQGQRTQHPGR